MAPNGTLLLSYESRGDRNEAYAHMRVEFDGNTAGRFGSAIEERCVAERGNEILTLRVTTTRYRFLAFPEIVDAISRVGAGFRVLP